MAALIMVSISLPVKYGRLKGIFFKIVISEKQKYLIYRWLTNKDVNLMETGNYTYPEEIILRCSGILMRIMQIFITFVR